MKVFISWSGNLSRALAVELRDWLPMVVHHVEAWISRRDIDPGQRWALVLGRELAESDFAVICLTPDNKQSPWVLFEAGAVARSLEARVVPLLFGITASDLDGPLAQFQSVQADYAGIEKLVSALYESSRSGLEAHQRELVFARLWPLFEERLAALTEQARGATDVKSPTDLVADLATPSEQAPATTLHRDVLESLEQEQERLHRELKYLESEEEKLTEQDAPISLERAIEPTQNRLKQVELTVKMVLDRVFAELTPSQLATLRDLALQPGIRLMQPLKRVVAQEDLEVLTRLGLVTISDQGLMLSHDLVADYIYTTVLATTSRRIF